ncbi:MAG: hypothetical protein KYX62_09975 [Pseudomonadota bacterium]|nr:hypothetical protein [Pseudomonadota bacterium]
MTIKVSAGIALLSAAVATQAGTVDSSAMTTFQSGTAAVASEVNGNFTAVTTAVDANATDISTLQSAIEDLQAQIDALPQEVTDASDLVGRTYCMVQNHTAGRYEGDDNYASVNAASETSTLSITSSTQFSVTGNSADEMELGLSVQYYTYDGYDIAGLTGSLQSYSEPESFTGTINSFSNGTLSVTVGTDSLSFYVSKYGDVMIGRSFSDEGTEMWNTTFVMVECQ